MNNTKSDFHKEIQDFIRSGFKPNFGRLREQFDTNPFWNRLRELGSRLWLDTGSISDSKGLWTQEFSALTTNNTLLNKEIQTGQYDSLIGQAAQLLNKFPWLSEQEQMLEIAFILNARHGLRLVEKFDAYVSVEEHTDLANDVDRAVDYAKRYHAICPERFIVKIPFTPAGLLVTRKLSAKGIPINHTLGFSARQNYVIARIGKPAYVNVFLGRLNSFVVNNNLGDGTYIGEKATLASQAAVRELRDANITASKQIGASFRSGRQVLDLAGIDVMTMPPKVAVEFLSLTKEPDEIVDKTAMDYKPGLDEKVDRQAIRIDTLWDVDDNLKVCVEEVEKENLETFGAQDLIEFFKEHGCGDALVDWSETQIQLSRAEGKIPKLENWRDALAEKSIGLDSLMNLAGLNSFVTDQDAMDSRVSQVLSKAPAK
ncbi:MAG: transaldolase family protein [Sedimentisphaerales bacterium]|nr:transaldolase family protein [Sedimentisphaerales bacterium]